MLILDRASILVLSFQSFSAISLHLLSWLSYVLLLASGPFVYASLYFTSKPRSNVLIQGLVFKHAVYGAYSELYAAFSPDVTDRDNGGYLLAWGRKGILPPFVAVEIKGGKMEKFVGWCERECGSFL